MRIALLLTILGVLLMSVWLFVVHPWWFPAGVSAHAPAMDHQFTVAFGILGGLFIAGQLLLAFVIFRARAHNGAPSGSKAPRFPRGDWRFEAAWTIATTCIFFGLSLAGGKLWSQIRLHDAEP
ncbi:MAG: hypothetical protein LAP21_28385, partial [Acidobacteriia bacterium]|nr:hypothetical protein [Terriglobia bacterium]